MGGGTGCDADAVKSKHGARCLSHMADKGEGEGRFKKLVFTKEAAHVLYVCVTLDLSLVLIAVAAAAAATAAATAAAVAAAATVAVVVVVVVVVVVDIICLHVLFVVVVTHKVLVID